MPELDGIRAIALLMVLVYHYVANLVPARPYTLLWFPIVPLRSLSVGVDLFFVLSGFLIGGILLDAKGSASYFGAFYGRRVFRIFPLYFAWYGLYLVLLASGVLNWLPSARDIFAPTIPAWWYAVFLQNVASAHLRDFGPQWLATTWSLAIEEQFYAVAPLLIRALNSTTLLWLCLAAIVAAPILRVSYGANWYAQDLLTWCRADDLALGILAAIVVRERGAWEWFLSKQSVLIAGFVGLLALDGYLSVKGFLGQGFFERTLLGTGWGLFFWTGLMIVVTGALPLVRSVLASPILRYVGKVSFAVYIFHQPLLYLLHNVFFKADPVITGFPTFGATLLSLAIAFGLADLSWRFFEHPLIRWAHARFRYEDHAELKRIFQPLPRGGAT
jgi:peptidoglycan/LPS O-acetylase OafA/YrhL